jgi:hypothetical protein
MENTIETKHEMTQDALDWGIRPTIEGRDEPPVPLTAGDWTDGFANRFIDFYTNKINLPALRARADGEPEPNLEEWREDLGLLYALAGEPDRIHWDCEGMAFLWEKFLGTLSQPLKPAVIGAARLSKCRRIWRASSPKRWGSSPNPMLRLGFLQGCARNAKRWSSRNHWMCWTASQSLPSAKKPFSADFSRSSVPIAKRSHHARR